MTQPGSADVVDATRAVLLAVRLKAVADAAAIVVLSEPMSLSVDDVETLLGRLELAGLVEHREGSNPGWRLTDDGRSEGERLLAVELDERGVRQQMTAAYERFVLLNGALLRACTDWQLRDALASPPLLNDHTDAEHDDAVLGLLRDVHAAVLPICDDLSSSLPRLAGYASRFATAIDRVNGGEVVAVDGPDSDSYHAIWFELHENLVATLGRDRATEPLPDPTYRPPAIEN